MKIVVRSFFLALSVGTLLTQPSQAVFKSTLFTYDDPQSAKGLHVSLQGSSSKGIEWRAQEVTEADIPFYQGLFGDQKVMTGFADGKIRSPEFTAQRLGAWISRFQNGHPHGGLTVFRTEDQETLGHIVAGAGDAPGVSEIAYSYVPTSWGTGLGSAVLGTIVQQWGPEVRRIGLGIGLDEIQDANIVTAFKCFGGKTLERFDATASPSNPGSWKILDKFGFGAATFKVENLETPLDLDNRELQSPQALEENILNLFHGSGDNPYKIDTRYQLIDTEGKLRTFSKHAKYDRIKYHFEYFIP
jgi:RimJ/RimL family protein N-acetyltransferase